MGVGGDDAPDVPPPELGRAHCAGSSSFSSSHPDFYGDDVAGPCHALCAPQAQPAQAAALPPCYPSLHTRLPAGELRELLVALSVARPCPLPPANWNSVLYSIAATASNGGSIADVDPCWMDVDSPATSRCHTWACPPASGESSLALVDWTSPSEARKTPRQSPHAVVDGASQARERSKEKMTAAPFSLPSRTLHA